MMIVLSPAKSLDFQSNIDKKNSSKAVFRDEANEIVSVLRKMSPKQITDLMNVSTRLANLNFERFRNWKENPDKNVSRQAVFAFKGDVYQGLQIEKYNNLDLEYAQEHLRILSGVYGILRPLDLIQPYRLEMGTNMEVSGKDDLYAFWTDKISRQLKKDLSKTGNILINLASREYFKAIDLNKLNAEVITPVFKNNKSGTYKIISIYAKKARGKMASFILRNRIKDIEELKAFEEDGYVYNPGMSTDKEPVFTRG